MHLERLWLFAVPLPNDQYSKPMGPIRLGTREITSTLLWSVTSTSSIPVLDGGLRGHPRLTHSNSLTRTFIHLTSLATTIDFQGAKHPSLTLSPFHSRQLALENGTTKPPGRCYSPYRVPVMHPPFREVKESIAITAGKEAYNIAYHKRKETSKPRELPARSSSQSSDLDLLLLDTVVGYDLFFQKHVPLTPKSCPELCHSECSRQSLTTRQLRPRERQIQHQ